MYINVHNHTLQVIRLEEVWLHDEQELDLNCIQLYTQERPKSIQKRSNYIHRERGINCHEPEAYINNEPETNMYTDLNVYTRDVNLYTRDAIICIAA